MWGEMLIFHHRCQSFKNESAIELLTVKRTMTKRDRSVKVGESRPWKIVDIVKTVSQKVNYLGNLTVV